MGNKQPLNALTGIRFVAASVVFIHHLGGKFGFDLIQYRIGSLAVTFFFVLSGFILTYVYHDRLDGSASKRKYLFTRIARIWPLHIAVLLVFISTLKSWDSFSSAGAWWKLLVNGLLLQSWLPHSDWAYSFNPVSWSISTEAFFYVVFPLLFFPGGRLAKFRFVALSVVVAIGVVVMNFLSQQAAFEVYDFSVVGRVNPLLRIPEFCVGMLTGFVFLKRSGTQTARAGSATTLSDTGKEMACLLAIVAAAWCFRHWRVESYLTNVEWGSRFLGTWSSVIYPVILFAITISVFAKSRGILSWLFSCRWFVFLGDVSYAFYMIHYIVLRYVYLATPSYGYLNGFSIGFCCFGIALGLAILLYLLIEMPAKTFLIGWYDNGLVEALKIGLLRTSKNAYSIAVPIAIFMAVVPAVVLRSGIPQVERSAEIQQVIRLSKPELRNVRFGSQIVLLGCQVIRKDDGQVKLGFAWKKRTDISRRRIVRLLDGNGETIGRGTNNAKLFAKVGNGDEFIDETRLPADKLKFTKSVEILFRAKNKPALRVDSRHLSSPEQSLIVLSEAEIVELVDR